MAEVLDQKECRLLADLLAAFANPVRLRLFCRLQAGACGVSELAEYAGISLQNASQHLRLMRDKGTVVAEKQGQQVVYTIADARFLQGMCLLKEGLFDAVHRKLGVASGSSGRSTRGR
jgi:DNA-binding transcriptional ArsR family regulator